jgi:hypothetical protein
MRSKPTNRLRAVSSTAAASTLDKAGAGTAQAIRPLFIQRKCMTCEEEDTVQRKEATSFIQGKQVGSVDAEISDRIEGSKGGGQSLSPGMKSFMEQRLGSDLSDVRVHTDGSAARLSQDLNANAFTVGRDIFFGKGRFVPDSDAGKRLLAHELTHTVQQGATGQTIQKEDKGTAPRGGGSVNSPIVDETLVTISDIHAGIAGRALLHSERAVVEAIFGNSVDYGRVRIIIGDIAARTTAGNNIRLPANFSIAQHEEDKQLLVHEMTHVWQFQHNGAGYITTSLLQQLSAGATRGSRNFAYDYRIGPRNSFFEYAPEQQASIVENYYAMLQDQPRLTTPDAATRRFRSNHLGADGFNAQITAAQRTAEIAAELPNHQRLIGQMSSTPFLNTQSLMLRRQEDLMIMPPDMFGMPMPGGSGFTPTPSLLTIRF